MGIEAMLNPPDKAMRSSGMFEDIREYVQAFEKSLRPDQQVGLMFAAYGSSTMLVNHISYRDPALFIFKGFIDGKESVLIQHRSQLNFILIAEDIPDKAPKRRTIGFSLAP